MEFLNKIKDVIYPVYRYKDLYYRERDIAKKKDMPLRYFIFDTIPEVVKTYYKKYISDPFYNLQCKYIRKYHCIRIDVDRFNLDGIGHEKKLSNYHWFDDDVRLLWGMFQVLVDFVEQQYDIVSWEGDNKEIGEEIKFLYKWWTEYRPKRELERKVPSRSDFGLQDFDLFERNQEMNSKDKANFSVYRDALDEYHNKENYHDLEDTEMLIRLIKIRAYLWT